MNNSALESLKNGAATEFDVPELLLDIDFSGHYKRRILHRAWLLCGKLLEHKCRVKVNSTTKESYGNKSKTVEMDPRLKIERIPITAIAVSIPTTSITLPAPLNSGLGFTRSPSLEIIMCRLSMLVPLASLGWDFLPSVSHI